MIGTLTLVDQNPQARMQNLRHELARYIWQARTAKMDLLELDNNLRSLVALCPDKNIELANKLMHDVRNTITKIYGFARLEQLKNNSNN
jgi:hypothetical protein